MHARARALLKLKPASQDDRLDIEDDDDDEEVKCQEEGGHEESSCPPMKLRRRGRGGGAAVQQVTRSAARRVQGWRCWRVGRAERYRGGGSARAGRRRGALRACNGEARGRLRHAATGQGALQTVPRVLRILLSTEASAFFLQGYRSVAKPSNFCRRVFLSLTLILLSFVTFMPDAERFTCLCDRPVAL